jgi:hypothetical protein
VADRRNKQRNGCATGKTKAALMNTYKETSSKREIHILTKE